MGFVGPDPEVAGLRVMVKDRGPKAHWFPVSVFIPGPSDGSVNNCSILFS